MAAFLLYFTRFTAHQTENRPHNAACFHQKPSFAGLLIQRCDFVCRLRRAKSHLGVVRAPRGTAHSAEAVRFRRRFLCVFRELRQTQTFVVVERISDIPR